MTERSDHPQDPPAGDERPEVFSVSQDKDGSFHFSRRDFLYLSAAIGGTLLLRRACPRFGTNSAPGEPVQAGMVPLSGVYVHAAPSIASNIAATLRQDDFVRLISDRPDLGWVEVATRGGQHGWVQRSYVDFSRAIQSTSPNFDLSSTLNPNPTQTHPPRTLSVQLRRGEGNPVEVLAPGQSQACGEVIQNGNFEAGASSWVEESSGTIIRNDYFDPYQGSWVAWFGGPDANERLTQLFHVPANVLDAQRLYFWLKVTTEESGGYVYDTFILRFLDAGGNPITDEDIPIRDNTTPTDWANFYVDLNGMTIFADQDIQIQFECITNSTNDTSFVLDSVSLNLVCEAATPTPTQTPTQTETPSPVYYVYIPVVIRDPTPPPTGTPTSTPTPTKTPCPSHTPCPSDCVYHCPSDCSSDCPSDCGYVCIYDCPLDCIYYCGYDYCSYDCPYDW